MKILHTADLHIGQLFREYDQTSELGQFLKTLEAQVDALPINGNVYPFAATKKMFTPLLNPAAEVSGYRKCNTFICHFSALLFTDYT